MLLEHTSARRIAILKPSALGDIAHALPILPALRRRFPTAHITWVANSAYAPLLLGHPDLDRVITLDRHAFKSGLRSGLRGMARFAGQIRRANFDLVLDLQGLLRTGLMCLLSGARHRIGFADAREGASHTYTRRILTPARVTHAVDRYWLFAEALGVGDAPKRFHLPVQPDARSWAMAQLKSLPKPWMVVAPGARWLTKRWPHFGELARRAHSRFGGTVILLGGPDEIGGVKPHLDLTGKTDIARLAATISLADVVMANDSGPLHVAVALGRPVVAPYTCTSIDKHGPYGMSGGAVETRVACQGSYTRTCDHMSCMTDLTPDHLWPILQRTLSAWQQSRSA